MISNLNRSLFAALVVGIASAANGYADEAADYAEAEAAAYQCSNNICEGMFVRVVGGQYVGHTGYVVRIDYYQDTVTVQATNGVTLYVRAYDLAADVTQPSTSGCVSDICIGDSVRILVGAYSGQIGQVVDADDYNYTATVLVAGRYIIEDVRDLVRTLRPSTPRPYPNYPRNCPIGSVYDIYRGCIRVSYPYPRPYPPRVPRPIPVPRHYPNPRGPVPPRMPVPPRAPMPPRNGGYQPPRNGGQPPRQSPNQGGGRGTPRAPTRGR